MLAETIGTAIDLRIRLSYHESTPHAFDSREESAELRDHEKSSEK